MKYYRVEYLFTSGKHSCWCNRYFANKEKSKRFAFKHKVASIKVIHHPILLVNDNNLFNTTDEGLVRLGDIGGQRVAYKGTAYCSSKNIGEGKHFFNMEREQS